MHWERVLLYTCVCLMLTHTNIHYICNYFVMCVCVRIVYVGYPFASNCVGVVVVVRIAHNILFHLHLLCRDFDCYWCHSCLAFDSERMKNVRTHMSDDRTFYLSLPSPFCKCIFAFLYPLLVFAYVYAMVTTVMHVRLYGYIVIANFKYKISNEWHTMCVLVCAHTYTHMYYIL